MSFVHPAMTGLKAPLEAFHDATGGNLQEIAELFAAMSGQFLPPEILCQLMGVELGGGEGLPTASKEQLLRGIEAALDDGDTAEKYAPIIEAQTGGLEARRELARKKEAFEVSCAHHAATQDVCAWSSMGLGRRAGGRLVGSKGMQR